MRRILSLLAGVSALASLAAPAQPAPDLSMARLDCGSGMNDQRRFSDTFAYSNPQIPFTFSCYVIRHGDETEEDLRRVENSPPQRSGDG